MYGNSVSSRVVVNNNPMREQQGTPIKQLTFFKGLPTSAAVAKLGQTNQSLVRSYKCKHVQVGDLLQVSSL
uniref:Uncharacterized protein n=1 Tax=Anguilla anguilla TaxID=7936 RepID=A0A0E9SUZ9_ANGAN